MTLRYLTADEAAREAERLIDAADSYHHRSEALIARMAAEADRLIEARGGIARPRVPYRMARFEETESPEEIDERAAKLETDSIAGEISRRLAQRENGGGLQ